MYYVYLIEMANGKIYTGYTADLDRRLRQHRSGNGARTTRAFGVSRLLHSEPFETKSEAMRREHELKTWPRSRKLALLAPGST